MLQYDAVFKGHHYGYVLKNHNPKADDLFFFFLREKGDITGQNRQFLIKSLFFVHAGVRKDYS
ncbi:hypothetical protein CHH65_07920 [Shouchella clausii]|nr:hypothetical protein CHH65_07920 [Shouchella clausii]